MKTAIRIDLHAVWVALLPITVFFGLQWIGALSVPFLIAALLVPVAFGIRDLRRKVPPFVPILMIWAVGIAILLWLAME
jgi:hypothetical protein